MLTENIPLILYLSEPAQLSSFPQALGGSFRTGAESSGKAHDRPLLRNLPHKGGLTGTPEEAIFILS